MANEKLPLFKHRNGQWAKKIKGKMYYFGTDYESALDAYLEDKDHLHAGRGKPAKVSAPTIQELGNVYYARCQERVSSGDMTPDSLEKTRRTIDRLVKFRGGKDRPGFWTPEDYREIKAWLFEPVERTKAIRGGIKQGRVVSQRSLVTVDGDIRRIKAFLNWCLTSRLIQHLNFGEEFSQSTKKQLRKSKSGDRKKTFDPESLKSIIGQCRASFLPVVMLGINGGMGARDIAGLKINQVENAEWLECPRQKTGAQRKIWLWPETRLAISNYLKIRREPWDKSLLEVAFLTSHREAWVRDTQDAASQSFTEARRKAEVASGTFYDLRRTFQTIGEETLDFPAVKFCMGHAPAARDMSSVYREVSDERIKRVCECVRKWLYPDAPIGFNAI